MEERDHRVIGKELDLFTFSDLVGPGLPLWTPKGTIFRNEIDKFIWEMREARGYAIVTRNDGALVRSVTQVQPGDTVQALLAHAELKLRGG